VRFSNGSQGLLPEEHRKDHAVLFPPVQGSNLARRQFHLPGDFEGERNLVLIAFQREQQFDVDTWSMPIKRLRDRYPDLRFYELPTIKRGNPVFRFWLDSAMRAGIPDRTVREQTITLYLDKEAFRSSLDLPSEETIYALLVDRQGRVLWRTEGPFTEAKGHELEQVLGAR
jgi:hypothetical protein